jgi:lipoprotein signal peptidase
MPHILNCSGSIFTIINAALILILALVYLKAFKKTWLSFLGLGLTLLGGGANLYERFEFGCVKDYLSFFGMLHFNYSDIIIVVGLSILTGGYLYEQKCIDR